MQDIGSDGSGSRDSDDVHVDAHAAAASSSLDVRPSSYVNDDVLELHPALLLFPLDIFSPSSSSSLVVVVIVAVRPPSSSLSLPSSSLSSS